MEKDKFKTHSAKEFYNKDTREYVFPFQALDDRTDGSSLGRIEWFLEPVHGIKK